MSDAIGVLSMDHARGTRPRFPRSRVLLEVDGVLRLTSVEYARDGRGFYSVNGYLLAGGLRAAPPDDAEDGQKLT